MPLYCLKLFGGLSAKLLVQRAEKMLQQKGNNNFTHFQQQMSWEIEVTMKRKSHSKKRQNFFTHKIMAPWGKVTALKWEHGKKIERKSHTLLFEALQGTTTHIDCIDWWQQCCDKNRPEKRIMKTLKKLLCMSCRHTSCSDPATHTTAALNWWKGFLQQTSTFYNEHYSKVPINIVDLSWVRFGHSQHFCWPFALHSFLQAIIKNKHIDRWWVSKLFQSKA